MIEARGAVSQFCPLLVPGRVVRQVGTTPCGVDLLRAPGWWCGVTTSTRATRRLRPVPSPGHGPVARPGRRERLPGLPISRLALRHRRAVRPGAPAGPGHGSVPARARLDPWSPARNATAWSGCAWPSPLADDRRLPRVRRPVLPPRPLRALPLAHQPRADGRELHRLRASRLPPRRPARHQGRPRRAGAPGRARSTASSTTRCRCKSPTPTTVLP